MSGAADTPPAPTVDADKLEQPPRLSDVWREWAQTHPDEVQDELDDGIADDENDKEDDDEAEDETETETETEAEGGGGGDKDESEGRTLLELYGACDRATLEVAAWCVA